MEVEEIEKYNRHISRLNELRRNFWMGLSSLRKDLLSKYRDKRKGPVTISDPDAKELLQTMNDMWESGVMEEMRRRSNTHRSRTIPLCPTCSSPLNDFIPAKKGGTGGLYTSDKLCVLCFRPLSGRQKKYCSETCRGIAKSRNFRMKNPDAKAKSNLKYLMYCYPEYIKKTKKSKL